jgi:hypothetical protein
MGWRDLLREDERIVLPWVGGRSLRSRDRAYAIEGPLPPEHGWYAFRASGRKAFVEGDTVDPQPEVLEFRVRGYLVGDRVVADGVRVDPDPSRIIHCSEKVHLIEPGLDRFVRVTAGRVFEDGPLVYEGLDMPLGPEEQVLAAFLDARPSVDDVRGVPPALDAAFRMETWQRAEVKRRREEHERRRREEEERRALEERRRELLEQLGDGVIRRRMARHDFESAAKAALAVGGAQYLDHRRSAQRGEMVVRFRLDHARFECTCDETTLRIIDAGICLVDAATDERGDTYFTLESLPGVIQQAIREGKLHVFRHVGDER